MIMSRKRAILGSIGIELRRDPDIVDTVACEATGVVVEGSWM
jgi:hypothetical protein